MSSRRHAIAHIIAGTHVSDVKFVVDGASLFVDIASPKIQLRGCVADLEFAHYAGFVGETAASIQITLRDNEACWTIYVTVPTAQQLIADLALPDTLGLLSQTRLAHSQ